MRTPPRGVLPRARRGVGGVLTDPNRDAMLDQLDRELPNLRAAIEFAVADDDRDRPMRIAHRAARLLAHPWPPRRRLAARSPSSSERAPRGRRTLVASACVMTASEIASWNGDYALAHRCRRRELAIATASGDPAAPCRGNQGLGWSMIQARACVRARSVRGSDPARTPARRPGHPPRRAPGLRDRPDAARRLRRGAAGRRRIDPGRRPDWRSIYQRFQPGDARVRPLANGRRRGRASRTTGRPCVKRARRARASASRSHSRHWRWAPSKSGDAARAATLAAGAERVRDGRRRRPRRHARRARPAARGAPAASSTTRRSSRRPRSGRAMSSRRARLDVPDWRALTAARGRSPRSRSRRPWAAR